MLNAAAALFPSPALIVPRRQPETLTALLTCASCGRWCRHIFLRYEQEHAGGAYPPVRLIYACPAGHTRMWGLECS